MAEQIARGTGRDVVLQAFHWNLVKTQGTGTIDGCSESWYEILRNRAPEIAELGFTIVYLPPPWVDDSRWEAGGQHGGGEGYFWRDFDLNSRYGTKQELAALVTTLHENGVKSIVDLAVNHRDASRMQADIWEYPGPCWRRGGKDTGGRFQDGAYDLALGYPVVQKAVLRALNELMDDCGVDGWRWDFVWGYSVEDTVGWIHATDKTEYFSMGEYWQCSSDHPDDPMIPKYGRNERDRILGWAKDSKSCAFDILLKRAIQSADPALLKRGLNASSDREDRELVVTYVDSHDTGASPYSVANGWGQKHWECPPGFKSKAYAYILTMPGTPCVYWPDCFDWGMKEEIAALLRVRKEAGVISGSDWVDLTDAHTGFAAKVKNEVGDETLAVSIGSDYVGPGDGWTVACEKPGEWTVWLRG